MMRKLLAVMMFVPTLAFAEAIATMPNEGGGKIVLTDEVCKNGGKTYSALSRAYNYTTAGHSSEGCFFIEDETVVVIWDTAAGVRRMRYPAENFTIIKKKQPSSRYGT
jgi:hypothetical protein